MSINPFQIAASCPSGALPPLLSEVDAPSAAAVVITPSGAPDKEKNTADIVDREQGHAVPDTVVIAFEELDHVGDPPPSEAVVNPSSPANNSTSTSIVPLIRRYEDSGIRFEHGVGYIDIPPAYTHS